MIVGAANRLYVDRSPKMDAEGLRDVIHLRQLTNVAFMNDGGDHRGRIVASDLHESSDAFHRFFECAGVSAKKVMGFLVPVERKGDGRDMVFLKFQSCFPIDQGAVGRDAPTESHAVN